MDRVFRKIINHRKIVIAIFGIITIISTVLSTQVGVNYNILDYLPEDAKSTKAIDTMNKEFGAGISNCRIMIKDIEINEAVNIKKEISNIKGVREIIWLDDNFDTTIPLEIADTHLVDEYYKDNNALYTVTIDEEYQIDTLNNIRTMLDEKSLESSFMGTSVDIAATTTSATSETSTTTVIVVIICFIVLLLTTSSWYEPILFMLTIGIAVILNKGTNIIFGEISFVTNSAAAILQLAVSMDYSIFLLHRFADYRNQGMSIKDAIIEAQKSALSTIMASGLTTVIGFAALILMRFKIGADMGWVMAKSIILSMIVVLVLLPVLTVVSYKLIDKTHHKFLFSKFDWLAKFVFKIKIPVLIIFILILVPGYIAQTKNSFYYGASNMYTQGQIVDERNDIEETFGKSNQMVLLVKKGDFDKEKLLSNELHDLTAINSIISYVDVVGAEIPTSFVEDNITSKLISENYSRMIMTVSSNTEGENVFKLVDKVNETTSKYYQDYHLLGQTVNTYDLKTVIEADMVKVNLIAVVAIFIVLLFTLRSITLPFILVLAIESAVWVNTAFPYFTNDTVFYIAYLIVTSIQLGATVDYAILLTSRYLEERQVKPRRKALHDTVCGTALSIFTSGAILTLGALTLGMVATNGILAQLGVFIGRGALLSLLSVLLILPAMLYFMDKFIEKTTKNVQFVQDIKEIKEDE